MSSPPPIAYVESSGGLFRDMMIHDLDMACFLLGETPTEVFAIGSALVDPAIGEVFGSLVCQLRQGVVAPRLPQR